MYYKLLQKFLQITSVITSYGVITNYVVAPVGILNTFSKIYELSSKN